MAGRVLPNVGLTGFWDLGEDGWKDENDLNLLKLSVLVQAVALAKVSEEPVTPSNGDVYILDETHSTHPNEIAIRDDDAWVYVQPGDGWLIFNQDAGYYEQFSMSLMAWAELEMSGGGGGGGIAEAPNDGKYYARRNEAWAEFSPPASSAVVTISGTSDDLDPADEGKYQRWTNSSAKTLTVEPEATTAQPANGEWHLRNVGEGNLTITPGSGVTIHPPAGGSLVVPTGGTVTLKRVAEDEFDLMGLTVAE